MDEAASAQARRELEAQIADLEHRTEVARQELSASEALLARPRDGSTRSWRLQVRVPLGLWLRRADLAWCGLALLFVLVLVVAVTIDPQLIWSGD